MYYPKIWRKNCIELRVIEMSNRLEHMVTGFCVGGLIYALMAHEPGQPVDWNKTAVYAGVGAGVAAVPDILEPPTSPRHRGIAHSASGGVFVLSLAKKLMENPNITPEGKRAIAVLAAGYISHLVLDAETPAGLPLMFRGE